MDEQYRLYEPFYDVGIMVKSKNEGINMKYVQLELFNNKTSIIISLKYEYLEKILNGEKKYEYRFKFPHENVEAYIYIPSPYKKLVGVMEFDCTEWMNKEDASIFYQNIGDGEYETLYNWIGDKKGCYVSRICSLLLFNEEIEFDIYIKKRIGNVIDMNTNIKVKERKGYEYWATKHNLNTMAESVIFLREQGIKSVKQLDEYIQKTADERQNLQDKIKAIDKEIQELSATMEQVHTVKKYRQYYKEYKANSSDKAFFEEYKAQITLYENSLSELKKSYSKLPNSKDILDRLDKLQEKKNTLMQEYSSTKSTMDELYQIRKNYRIYMVKEMER